MTAPFPHFFHSDIIIDFSGDGCSRCRFQGHSTECTCGRSIFRIDDAEQVVCVQCLSLSILFGALRSLTAPAPSTTMTSAYCLGAGTVGTSALRTLALRQFWRSGMSWQLLCANGKSKRKVQQPLVSIGVTHISGFVRCRTSESEGRWRTCLDVAGSSREDGRVVLWDVVTQPSLRDKVSTISISDT